MTHGTDGTRNIPMGTGCVTDRAWKVIFYCYIFSPNKFNLNSFNFGVSYMFFNIITVLLAHTL